MTIITKKLKSQSGASMLISLIFFLTAFMVGTVVLSSAAANSDKLIVRREESQRYFALSSAARFLRSTIEGTKGEAWKEETNYACMNSSYDIINTSGNQRHSNTIAYSRDMTIADSDAKIQALLVQTAFKMYNELRTNPNAPSIKAEFTVEVADMEPVDVVITMSDNYNLLIELKMQGREETMTMSVVAAVKTTTSETETTCTHIYREKYIGADGVPSEREVSGNFAIKKPRVTTEVSWPTATIAKGVATP